MGERRASRRQKSFLRGVVNFDKRRGGMACLIRDLSDDGARIILSRTVTIPDVIELHIPQRGRTVPARVQWRRADEIGLAFTETPPPRPRRNRASSCNASRSSKPKSLRSDARSSGSSVKTPATAKLKRL